MNDATKAAEKEALCKRFDEYLELYRSNKLKEIERFYTDDARIYEPDAETTIGKDAIVKWLEGFSARGIVHGYYDIFEMEVPSPDFAFSLNMFTPMAKDGHVPFKNKYLALWKKVDGLWLLYRIINNSRPVM